MTLIGPNLFIGFWPKLCLKKSQIMTDGKFMQQFASFLSTRQFWKVGLVFRNGCGLKVLD